MPFSRRFVATLLSAMAASMPLSALAGGFYLQEQSPKETGRALSGGAAAADDPSTIYFNPAAMTQLPGIQMSAGGVLLSARTRQSNRGSTRDFIGLSPVSVNVSAGPASGATTFPISGGDGGNPFASVIPVPSFYATGQVGDRLWLGLGVTAPFGLKLDYDEDFFGRYDSLHTDLKTYNIQPSAAYRLTDALSVGGGVDVQYVKVKLTNAMPGPLLFGLDNHVGVTGDDWSLGWNAGLFYTNGTTNIGLHYRSGMTHKVEGRFTLTPPNPFVPVEGLPATAPLILPDIVTASLMHRLTPRLRAMLTARWYNWSVFREIAIRSAGVPLSVKEMRYHDSYSVSVGGDYDLNESLTLRAGTMFDRTPTNNAYLTTRIPDGDRVWLSAGATWNISSALALNLSYAHNFVAPVTIIRAENHSSTASTVTRARSTGNVDQLAASLTARF